MKDDKKVPQLRFPEFTDAWKQRKLGDIATFLNGRAYSQDELQSSGKYKILRVGNFYTNDSWYYSDMELGEKFYANKGDLLYTWSATFGPHIWEGDKVIYHYHIWKIALTEFLDKMFALQLLEQDKSNLLNNLNGSTMVHMTKLGMESKQVIIPNSLEEQAKIGSFFTQLDNTITLQQRKLNSLQKLKKGLLQKMFPKKGENIPEIRFPEFSDAWKQRKFGEFVERKSDSALSSTSIPSVEYENVESETGILKKDIYVKTEFKKGVLFSDKDVLYGKLRPYLHNWLAPSFTGVAVGDWWVLSPKNCSKDFLYRLLQTLTFDEIANQTSGTKMPRADWNLVSSTAFYIPSSIEEQAKIGSLFNRIDSTITLQQRKLESLQKLKKGLLQQMFI